MTNFTEEQKQNKRYEEESSNIALNSFKINNFLENPGNRRDFPHALTAR